MTTDGDCGATRDSSIQNKFDLGKFDTDRLARELMQGGWTAKSSVNAADKVWSLFYDTCGLSWTSERDLLGGLILALQKMQSGDDS